MLRRDTPQIPSSYALSVSSNIPEQPVLAPLALSNTAIGLINRDLLPYDKIYASYSLNNIDKDTVSVLINVDKSIADLYNLSQLKSDIYEQIYKSIGKTPIFNENVSGKPGNVCIIDIVDDRRSYCIDKACVVSLKQFVLLQLETINLNIEELDKSNLKKSVSDFLMEKFLENINNLDQEQHILYYRVGDIVELLSTPIYPKSMSNIIKNGVQGNHNNFGDLQDQIIDHICDTLITEIGVGYYLYLLLNSDKFIGNAILKAYSELKEGNILQSIGKVWSYLAKNFYDLSIARQEQNNFLQFILKYREIIESIDENRLEVIAKIISSIIFNYSNKGVPEKITQDFFCYLMEDLKQYTKKTLQEYDFIVPYFGGTLIKRPNVNFQDTRLAFATANALYFRMYSDNYEIINDFSQNALMNIKVFFRPEMKNLKIEKEGVKYDLDLVSNVVDAIKITGNIILEEIPILQKHEGNNITTHHVYLFNSREDMNNLILEIGLRTDEDCVIQSSLTLPKGHLCSIYKEEWTGVTHEIVHIFFANKIYSGKHPNGFCEGKSKYYDLIEEGSGQYFTGKFLQLKKASREINEKICLDISQYYALTNTKEKNNIYNWIQRYCNDYYDESIRAQDISIVERYNIDLQHYTNFAVALKEFARAHPKIDFSSKKKIDSIVKKIVDWLLEHPKTFFVTKGLETDKGQEGNNASTDIENIAGNILDYKCILHYANKNPGQISSREILGISNENIGEEEKSKIYNKFIFIIKYIQQACVQYEYNNDQGKRFSYKYDLGQVLFSMFMEKDKDTLFNYIMSIIGDNGNYEHAELMMKESEKRYLLEYIEEKTKSRLRVNRKHNNVDAASTS